MFHGIFLSIWYYLTKDYLQVPGSPQDIFLGTMLYQL